jgi:inositol-phosphate phosphatase/L-galactose 1-phosphate phosphatase/histidinol-phosphatase
MFVGSDRAAFGRVADSAKLVRFGADCYAHGLLAHGFIDLVIEASLKPYDFSAMLPVVEGAGGIASDWRGANLTTASDGRVVVAGDRRTHDAALELLAA